MSLSKVKRKVYPVRIFCYMTVTVNYLYLHGLFSSLFNRNIYMSSGELEYVYSFSHLRVVPEYLMELQNIGRCRTFPSNGTEVFVIYDNFRTVS